MDIIGKTLGNILGKKKPSYGLHRSGGKDPRRIEIANRRGSVEVEDVYRKLGESGFINKESAKRENLGGIHEIEFERGTGSAGNIPFGYEYITPRYTNPSLTIDVKKPQHKREIMKHIHSYGWKGNVRYGETQPRPIKRR